MHSLDHGATVGSVLIGLSACVQIVCLFLTSVLVNLHHGSRTSTLLMWLNLAAFFEQMSYIVYINMNCRDVQRQNVVNNVDMSSLRAP